MFRIIRRHRRALTRRVLPAVAGLAIASGAVAIGANPASAAGPYCHYNGQYNACLWVTETSPGSDVYEVHIGIDVYMSQGQASDILARGGGFYARAMGDDPSYDNLLFYVDRQYQTLAPHGLSAEFHKTVSGAKLNEDWGQDEVYGSIGLTNPGWGTLWYSTGVISGDF
jgi:hypothetical protein